MNCIHNLIFVQKLQVIGNIGVVTEGTTLKKFHKSRFFKYQYLHVKIASLIIVKLYKIVGNFCEWDIPISPHALAMD